MNPITCTYPDCNLPVCYVGRHQDARPHIFSCAIHLPDNMTRDKGLYLVAYVP